MINRKVVLSAVALSVVASASAQKEQLIDVQNMFRVGYDDNVYQSNVNEQDTAWISDVFNIQGSMRFSGASDFVFSYQPELIHRFDADPELVQYHDAYARLEHALSENVELTVADSFRYQLKDAQSGASVDANFYENTLSGALRLGVDELTSVMLGAGYGLRQWDEDSYGVVKGNNYDRYDANVSLYRDLQEDTTAMVALRYMGLDYEGTRGSVDVTTVLSGLDHDFTTTLFGYGRVGASFREMDNVSGDGSSSSPYLSAGFDYAASDKTSLNGSLSYTTSRADNSVYNAQDQLNATLALKQQLSAKVSLVSSLMCVNSSYESDSAQAAGALDADDTYVKMSVRGSYKINNNNYLELGYEYSDRDTDVVGLSDYDRNRVDIGWRVRM